MNKYLKVMFDDISGADDSFIYKINEVNIATNWNPNASNPKEMGGFNFSTEDKILRWLIRGDTLYDVIIPDDAEIVECENESAPHGVFRTNKIIVFNPRKITDKIAMELYKKSNLPEKSYYKALAGCAICGYINTCNKIIEEKINKENIELVLKEWNDFVKPNNSTYNVKSKNSDNGVTYNNVLNTLENIYKYKNNI